MRGCLLLVVGIVVGVVLCIVVPTLIAPKAPVPPPTPISADLDLRFSDAFLTRELQAQISQVPGAAPLKGVVVQSEPGQMVDLVGTAAIPGSTAQAPIRVSLRPVVANNKISIQVVQTQVGILKLPGSLFSVVEGTINQELNRALANQQYRIVGVSTTVDGVVVDVDLNH